MPSDCEGHQKLWTRVTEYKKDGSDYTNYFFKNFNVNIYSVCKPYWVSYVKGTHWLLLSGEIR